MADNTVAITAGSGTSIRTVTNAGADGGAHQQVVTTGNADGTLNPNDPDGTFNVGNDPTTLLIDSFDAGTLTNWTTGGTAPTTTVGKVTFPAVTTVSVVSYMRTNGTFALMSGAYLRVAMLVQLETTTITNNARWWGYGTNATTPTAAAAVLNGAVFQIDYVAGALLAVYWANGVRTTVATLTKPTDGLIHRYEVWYRQSVIYWVIDGAVVATVAMPNLYVASTQYMIAGSANFTTAASAAPTFVLQSAGVTDTGRNNHQISDGVLPWLKATVKAPSTASVAADLPQVVALHPSSPTPALAAGTNTIGAVGILSSTGGTGVFYVSTATNAAQVVKASAGSLQSLLISNTTAATQYVKLFNATAVTLGTTAAAVDIPVAAGQTLTLPFGSNGQRFTTGICFVITGAAGATNNTANTAGVYVALTYV